MIRPLIAATILALPLAACGKPASEGGTASANITVPAGDYAERLRAMTDTERNAVFYRAIHDAGRPCQQVTEATAIPDVNGQPAWAATCEDKSRWVIILGNAGVVQVASAAELEAAGKAR
ncbi:hypothetical protein ACFB49_31840 [Sphingomonas sp. DBB INV C78]|uniref:hypothetical protein n=1 Tax=Sphingomonas sp. DBB INV C78 TaxID=3349434 RepID=UPI0036D3212E